MAALPKFDSCSLSFAKAIGDVVTSVTASGNKLTDDERDGYINRAMNKLFTEYWTAVKGNTEAFIDIFPELLRNVAVPTTSGVYALSANGTYDFFKLHSAYVSTTIIKCIDKTLQAIVVTSNNELYRPSTSNFIAIEMEGSITFYPLASFPTATSVNIQYVRRPVLATTGGAFFNDGTVDIPFNANWIENIVQIALELYKQDTQET